MGILTSFLVHAQAFTQLLMKNYFNANKLLSASYQIGSIIGASIGGIIVHFDPFLLFLSMQLHISYQLFDLFTFYRIRKNNDTINFLKSNFEGFKYLFRRKMYSP